MEHLFYFCSRIFKFSRSPKCNVFHISLILLCIVVLWALQIPFSQMLTLFFFKVWYLTFIVVCYSSKICRQFMFGFEDTCPTGEGLWGMQVMLVFGLLTGPPQDS